MAFSVIASRHLHSKGTPLTRHPITPRLSTLDFQPLKVTSLSIRPLQITNPAFSSSRFAPNDLSNGTEVDLIEFERYMKTNERRVIMDLETAVTLRHPLRLHESMRHNLMTTQGITLSAICITSCQIVGGDVSRAMPVACAFDMMGTVILIRDDLPCMDDSDLRQGKPANHKAFDEATALLAGDTLICLAFEHLACHAGSMSSEQFVRVMMDLSSVYGSKGVQGGQMMDKLCEGMDDVGLAELEYIHMHKTAKIVGASAACGAIVGGGNEDEIERLRRFGTKTGFLFQVVDDIINVTKTREETRKSVGSDLASDKLTYVKLMGIEGARRYADQLLDDVLRELSWFDPEKVAPLRCAAINVHNQQN